MRIDGRPMPAKLELVRNILPFFLLFSCTGAALGQPAAAALTPAQAQALVERALATEVRTARDLSHPMRYRLRKSSPRLTTTKEIAETRDGDVARLVAINDQPLSQADEQQEQHRHLVGAKGSKRAHRASGRHFARDGHEPSVPGRSVEH